MAATVNKARRAQLLELMADHGWDLLILYGHAWRKDFFRCLINVNFSGPHAVVVLFRSGEVQALASDPWDAEVLSGDCAADFAEGLVRLSAAHQGACIGVAGLELMEARFVLALRGGIPGSVASASAEVEELRRVKTPEEIDALCRAAELANRGYEHLAQVIEARMAEYELVAEVESFLKSNGAEDNFMLIASGARKSPA